jgi:hypothetical protein
MLRRLVIPVFAGCLWLLASHPALAQRATEWFVLDDDLLAQQPPPPPPKPALARLPAQVWKTLAPFRNSSEFDGFRRKARDIAKSHGWSWGFIRQRVNDGPLLAQQAAEPCDPAVEDCGDSLDEVSVSGMRASSANSITNNQVAGVDEGDIVKAFDRFLVVLMHGRLFSVDTGGAPGELRLIDRVDTYQDTKDESWVDEILLVDDTVLVTGYSYETNSSNIALFRIDKQGRFKFLARYFIESDDYYSWENYAGRIVDGKLVIYTPFDLSEYPADQVMPLPRIRRFTADKGFSEWQPLFSVTDIYRPIQPAVYPGLHVMSVCPVDPGAELRCEARGIVGPTEHEMYVAPDHAYLWLTKEECAPGQNTFRKQGSPSAVYRMTVSDNSLAAVHAEGFPKDQFSLEEKGAHFWALVHRPPLVCDALDADGEEYEPLALIKIGESDFSTRPQKLLPASYFDMPHLSNPWEQQTRFSARHVMYGDDGGRWLQGRGYVQAPSELVVVPLADPVRKKKLALGHGVTRLELLGNHAVVFGGMNEDLAVSSVWLSARPRVVDTQTVAGATESEGRSHAFNSITSKQGDGLFGLPIVYHEEYRTRWREAPTYVHFFSANRELQLEDAAQLKGNPPEEDESTSSYECLVSCYDWYGNSRPIFFRDRIFALIGGEVLEGKLVGGRVTESARLSLIGTPEHAR